MLLMTPDAELDCKICEMIIDVMTERIKVCERLIVDVYVPEYIM